MQRWRGARCCCCRPPRPPAAAVTATAPGALPPNLQVFFPWAFLPAMQLPWRKQALGSGSTALEALRGADLSGRVAVVTGGNGGVGLETVRALAHAGADVLLCSRSLEAGRAAAEQLAADTAVPLKVSGPAAASCVGCWQLLRPGAGRGDVPTTTQSRVCLLRRAPSPPSLSTWLTWRASRPWLPT